MEVEDADVAQLGRPRHEGVEEHGRRGCGAMEIDLVAGLDTGDGLFGGVDSHASRIGQRGRRPGVRTSRHGGPKVGGTSGLIVLNGSA